MLDIPNTCYIAILGHTESSIELTYSGESATETHIINGTLSSTLHGFSITGLSKLPTGITIANNVGSILLGTFYDFPHSPDLKLTLSYEYDGIKEITTKGGSTLTNQFYSKPPDWGGLGAWELGSNYGMTDHSKSGRRVWDLSFSYLSDSSIFPTNAGTANEAIDATTDLPTTTNTLLEVDTFQRVIHLTKGGQLPFIFQIDGTQNSDGVYNNSKPDSFAIAKFDMKSFKFSQVANGVYSMKLKIREVW